MTAPKKRSLYGDSLLLFIMTQSGSVFHFGFQWLMRRSMAGEQYDLMVAYLNIFLLIYWPCFTLQVVVSRYTSEAILDPETGGRIGPSVRWFLNRLGLICGGLVLIFTICMVPLANLYGTDQTWAAIPLSFFIAMSLFILAGQGVLQGLQAFWPLGWVVFLTGVTKCLLGGMMLLMVRDFSWILAAVAASCIPVLTLLFILGRRQLPPKQSGSQPDREALKTLLRYIRPVFLANIPYGLLLFGDMLIIRPKFEAGFGTAAIFGKAANYLPWALLPVMLPKVTTAVKQGFDPRGIFFRIFFLGTAVSIPAVLVTVLFPEFVLKLVGEEPHRMENSVRWLRLYSIGMIATGLYYVMMNYLLAIRRYHFLWLLISATIILFGGMIFFAESVDHCMYILVGVAWGLLLTTFPMTLKKVKKRDDLQPLEAN